MQFIKNNCPGSRCSDNFGHSRRPAYNRLLMVLIVPVEILMAFNKRGAGRRLADLARTRYKCHLPILPKMLCQQRFVSSFHSHSIGTIKLSVKTNPRQIVDWSRLFHDLAWNSRIMKIYRPAEEKRRQSNEGSGRNGRSDHFMQWSRFLS